jgi:hypothetical protein
MPSVSYNFTISPDTKLQLVVSNILFDEHLATAEKIRAIKMVCEEFGQTVTFGADLNYSSKDA